jgi:hypothetical protein
VATGCVPQDGAVSTTRDAEPGVFLGQDVFACFTKAAKIDYVADPSGTDTWQTPAETAARGTGDCEDICIYLQHLLAEQGVAVDVVFGLKDALATNGHAWIEGEFGGRLYVIEPRGMAMVERRKLPAGLMYIPAEDIDVVAEKIHKYHTRTGVYVNRRGDRQPQQEP